jgi:hypothetical protein
VAVHPCSDVPTSESSSILTEYRPLRASESFQRPCLHPPSILENGDLRNVKAFHNTQKHQNFLLQKNIPDEKRYEVRRTRSCICIVATSLQSVNNSKRRIRELRPFALCRGFCNMSISVRWDVTQLKASSCFEETSLPSSGPKYKSSKKSE